VRPRLRSGAFAPDCPLVILVRLRLPSDSLGRIEVARSQAHPDDGLLPSWPDALLGCALTTSAAGPAESRPRGRPRSAYALVAVCAGCACANVRELFANRSARKAVRLNSTDCRARRQGNRSDGRRSKQKILQKSTERPNAHTHTERGQQTRSTNTLNKHITSYRLSIFPHLVPVPESLNHSSF